MSFVRPFLTGFKTGFGKFGLKVSAVVNFILLFVVYFVGVGITAGFSRLAKKKFMDRELGRASYWIDRKLKSQTRETIGRPY